MTDFIKPNTAPYTSYFGKRVHPITFEVGKMHYGVDFSGHFDDNIIASASGTVIRTSKESSLGELGNYIILSHNIRGKIYTTIYGHLQKLNVSLGQTVKQGQLIGIKGNSGGSTSKHLHFEFHVNGGKLYTSSTAVDPLLYITDDSVLEVQKLLNKNGYKLVEDGINGNLTNKAIKDFQSKNGLVVDGIAGDKTIAKLKSTSTSSTTVSIATLKNGDKGNAVKALQTDLNKLGFRLGVDGVFGQGTLNAVKDFQNKNKLTVDGIFGAKSRETLNKLLK